MLKLILADDELLALDCLSKLVDWKSYGIELLCTCSDGRELMEHIRNNDADIVISDISMPFYSGIDASKYCYENHLDVEFVLLSAFRKFEYAQEAMRYGVKHYITKPYSRERLESIVAEVAEKCKAKKKENESAGFASSVEIQNFFSDVFAGNIEDEEDLDAKIKGLGISCGCGKVLDFEIPDFDKFMNEEWSYGTSRLFNALSILSFQKNGQSCFSLAYAKENRFSVLGLSENEEEFENYISGFSSRCKQILHIEIKLIDTIKFSDLRELIKESEHDIKSENDFLTAVNEYIEENYGQDITLDDAANAAYLNKTYFCSLYKKYTNETFMDALKKRRLEKSIDLLLYSDMPISQIYEKVGYKSKSYYYKVFKEYYGLTPIQYREKNKI